MKRKLKIMNHQIDQLKEEITAKESALVKEHLEHQRVEKEKDALKAELQRMKQEAAESKAYIEQQEAEERKLLKIISEADQERMRQKKELDQVCNGLLSWEFEIYLNMDDIQRNGACNGISGCFNFQLPDILSQMCRVFVRIDPRFLVRLKV